MTNEEVLDQFAAQAMQAILANQDALSAVTNMGSQAITYDEAVTAVAKRAYDVATAMMAERAARRRALPEVSFDTKKPLL